MADKKRKGSTSVSSPAQKKNKSSASTEPSTTTENDNAVKAKVNRKRAADFLDAEGEEAAGIHNDDGVAVLEKPAKKSKKSIGGASTNTSVSERKKKQRSGGVSLLASETNGVAEHNNDSDIENITEQELPQPVDGSDSESEGDEADHGAALLAGFDSDTEDPAEDKGLKLDRVAPIPNYKSTSKKLRNAAQKRSDGPGAVYVGRIPHGFYEKQMREYFSQFGDITKLRLSRNRRTGASKHFAFIEFASDEVAKIVAEAMDNYLMFGHILKCKYAPAENLHPDVWKGANKKFRKIPHDKLERQKLETPKTAAQWKKKNKKEEQKRRKNAAKLKELGYDLVWPTLKDPATALQERQQGAAPTSDENVLNGEVAEGNKAEEAADPSKQTSKKEKKVKKEKKAKSDSSTTNPLTEGNLGAQNAGHYVQAPAAGSQSKKSIQKAAAASTASAAPTQDTGETTSTKPAKEKKDKKEKKEKKEKKAKKSAKTTGGSTVTTDRGDYDELSSIPIGFDASGYSQQPNTSSSSNIDTVAGVADAVLKERKKDRKKEAKSKANKVEVESNVAAQAAEIAPLAAKGAKKEKKLKAGKGV